MSSPAILALEDGSVFHGLSAGIEGRATGEVVFNTAMTGYQEIVTDPSYAGQLVTLTYPHIGNVGTNPEDDESDGAKLNGLIIREPSRRVSNWRATGSLESYLADNGVVAIAGIDTRRLTRLLRDKGAQNGCIIAGAEVDEQAALEAARACPGVQGVDLAKVVSTRERYQWSELPWRLGGGAQRPEVRFRVIAYDYGIKRNILRMLVEQGCEVTVVPAWTPAEEVLGEEPDGVFLSNGPGDPEPCDYAIEAIRQVVANRVPTLGICLGHQLLGLACGARTVKMKFGHHGANHPVIDLETRRVMISSQNHGFAVDEDTLPAELRATHRSLFDHSLQGVHHLQAPAFGFQGHPEASPGPHDMRPLFRHFAELMAARRAT
ncbi:MAG TPA: glutamine-hydrolyzing carbamoyl-phosphate synthase small subunit [Gammaproteobacteria bacterium]|nr:glutamine-hydrolyzing carbamoyl-phosphate synthase small subunit [Gammaproteobacteria bacterium]